MNLSGIRHLFPDTAPVIYYVEAHPLYLPKVEKLFAMILHSNGCRS